MCMCVNRGGWVTQNFGVGDANANCSPDFVMFQNFKHQLACITMQHKAYQHHDFDSVFTTSQKYIFNLHQITTSGSKIQYFWRRHGQKKQYRSECTKISLSSEKFKQHPTFSPTKPSGSAPASPRFPARFTQLFMCAKMSYARALNSVWRSCVRYTAVRWQHARNIVTPWRIRPSIKSLYQITHWLPVKWRI